jgi:CDP-paratose 2-epimerase
LLGREASTNWNIVRLREEIPSYIHHGTDVRDKSAMEAIFKEYGGDIKIVLRTAAQPSHEWTARDPFTNFPVNGFGTLVLLEMT